MTNSTIAKSFVNLIVVPLLVGVLIIVLTRTAPDLRYTLSDKIPISFGDPAVPLSETVQQLEVRNVGNSEGKKIVVKINAQVTSYSVIKYSAADAVAVFDKTRPFELDYPELPPQGGFRLIFKAPGEGVENRDISISHSIGIAQEALSRRDPSVLDAIGPWAYYLGFFAYLIAMLYTTRRSLVGSWKTIKSLSSIDEIIQLKKPWYMSEKEWPSTYKDVVVKAIDGEYVATAAHILRSRAFRILTIQRPDRFDEATWDDIVQRCVAAVTEQYTRCMAAMLDYHKLPELLAIKRPQSFPQAKWDSLQTKISAEYVEESTKFLYRLDDTLHGLKEQKPEGVQEKHWIKRRESLQDKYYGRLSTYELPLQGKPLQFLIEQDLTVLDEGRRNELHRQATMLEKARQLPPTDSLEDLERFFNSERPDWISDAEYEQLKRKLAAMQVLRNVESREREIGVKEAAIVAERNELSALRARLERQLQIVHSILTDPTSIDRIEAFEDAFAPGNMANLRRIARTLGGQANT